MAGVNKGKITQIIGAVLDIKFSEGNLPEKQEFGEQKMNETIKKSSI